MEITEASGLYRHRPILALAILFPIFVYLIWLGRDVFEASGDITTIRPICGVALAFAMSYGRRSVLPVTLLVFLGGLIVRLAQNEIFWTSILASVSVALSIPGVYFATTKLMRGPLRFDNWEYLLKFMAICCAVAGITGVLYSLPAYGLTPDFWKSLKAWFVPTALSFPVLVPAVLNATDKRSDQLCIYRKKFLLALLVLFTTLALCFLSIKVPALFLIPLALLVLALGFEIEGASLGLLITYLALIVGVISGHSPTGQYLPTMGAQLYFVQIFLAILSVVVLPAGAVVGARQKLQDRLIELLRKEECTNAELREKKRNLQLLAQKAEAANRAKSEFLSNMSHELRTPLTSVIGFADLLHEDPSLSEQCRGFANRVRVSGRALLATINDVLDYSMIESGGLAIKPSLVGLVEVFDEIREYLEPQAVARGLAFRVEIESALKDEIRKVDAHRFRQILLNLGGNAIKFTPKGTIKLTLMQPAKDWLRCEVHDTGPGIEPKQRAKLFERFSQLDNTTTRKTNGTGLGLAICRGIVLAMGGRIGFRPALGQGSVFWFEIPAPVHHMLVQPSVNLPPAIARKNPRVLIADGVEGDRTLIRLALKSLDIETKEARDWKEASELAATERFDAILVNVHLSGLKQSTVSKEICGLCADYTPIVGIIDDEDGRRGDHMIADGFSAFLNKPLKTYDIRACVFKLTFNSYATGELNCA